MFKRFQRMENRDAQLFLLARVRVLFPSVSLVQYALLQ